MFAGVLRIPLARNTNSPNAVQHQDSLMLKHIPIFLELKQRISKVNMATRLEFWNFKFSNAPTTATQHSNRLHECNFEKNPQNKQSIVIIWNKTYKVNPCDTCSNQPGLYWKIGRGGMLSKRTSSPIQGHCSNYLSTKNPANWMQLASLSQLLNTKLKILLNYDHAHIFIGSSLTLAIRNCLFLPKIATKMTCNSEMATEPSK